MKASIYIGVLFAVLYAWFWMVDALVARGTDERLTDEDGLPEVEVVEVLDGIFVVPPVVRR